MFIILSPIYFLGFIFPFPNYPRTVISFDMVIATDAMPTHWAIYFHGSGLSLSFIGPSLGSMCKVHISLQELQAIAIMLCRMAFHLSGKVIALHLDNNTTNGYLCNQDGTVSPFLSRLACQILGIPPSMVLLLFQHAFLPTSVWRLIICPRIRCFQSSIFSLRWIRQLFTFGAFQRWTWWHLLIPLYVSIITPWNLHYLCGSWG